MIANEIKRQIMTGKYKVGEVIPTELELQKKHEVSRHTVRQAITVLSNEGYLRSEKGSGTYVDNLYLKRKNNSLVTQDKTIGVMTTYISNYIFPDIIHGIEKELRSQGYSLLLASTNNDINQERECLEMMLERNIRGLIVEPTKSNEYNPNLSYYIQLSEKNIPIVMINAYYEELSPSYVAMNDTKAGQILCDYLIKQGHRKIVMVTKIDDLQGKYRLKGFLKSYAQNKLPVKSNQIFTFKTSTEKTVIQEIIEYYKQSVEKPTAIICYNDEMAWQLIEALGEAQIKVPDEISIVGYDDSILSMAGQVEITTIAHPKEQMGIDAVNLLLRLITNKKEIDNIIYTPKLVERKSVKNICSDI